MECFSGHHKKTAVYGANPQIFTAALGMPTLD
jgi:hypothetical protein